MSSFAYRHSSFEALPFVSTAKPATPVVAPARKAKPQAQAKIVNDDLNEIEIRVLEHFRSHPAARPGTKKSLVRFLLARFRSNLNEAKALSVVESLSRGGHLVIGEKGKLTYQVEVKGGTGD